jgi:hypothetical protein
LVEEAYEYLASDYGTEAEGWEDFKELLIEAFKVRFDDHDAPTVEIVEESIDRSWDLVAVDLPDREGAQGTRMVVWHPERDEGDRVELRPTVVPEGASEPKLPHSMWQFRAWVLEDDGKPKIGVEIEFPAQNREEAIRKAWQKAVQEFAEEELNDGRGVIWMEAVHPLDGKRRLP